MMKRWDKEDLVPNEIQFEVAAGFLFVLEALI